MWLTTSAVILVLLLIACGAAIVSLVGSYRQSMLDAQKNQLLTISDGVANNLVGYLEDYQQEAVSATGMSAFREAEEETAAGRPEAMQGILNELRTGREQELFCVAYVPDAGDIMWEDSEHLFTLCRDMGRGGAFQDTGIYTDESGAYYFCLSAEGRSGTLLFYIPLQEVYNRTAAYIHMGEDGYVMIKDSAGIILMHPVKAQIGLDVLDDRKELYPGLDYSELELLVAHQLAGERGVEIYHSYWWADNPPSGVQKASAYVPAYIGNDFLSVSTVIDMREISDPIEKVGSRLLFATVMAVLLALILIILVRRLFRRQAAITRENERLKKINEDLEKLRQQEERLAGEQRLQLIGTMTSGIAHEFNNLLTPIMGYSAMILAGMQPEDENYADMQEIYDSAERAKEIIDQITQFSRKNAEKMREPIHVSEVVKKALVIADAVKPRHIKLSYEVGTEHDVCLANPVQINQMIVNLCNNAIQAIGEKAGEVTVAAAAMQPRGNKDSFFKGKEEQWFYRISVRDTGCGMSPETASQIFIPFFTTKKPGEGTGLGLSIVQRLVEAHGGYICVHSQEGAGTEFVIYLPAVDHPAEDMVEPAETQPEETEKQDQSE